jgi:hypothetical protein
VCSGSEEEHINRRRRNQLYSPRLNERMGVSRMGGTEFMCVLSGICKRSRDERPSVT